MKKKFEDIDINISIEKELVEAVFKAFRRVKDKKTDDAFEYWHPVEEACTDSLDLTHEITCQILSKLGLYESDLL